MTKEKLFVNAAAMTLVCRRFRSSYALRHYSPTLIKRSVVFSKISVNIYQVTRCHTGEITSIQNFPF